MSNLSIISSNNKDIDIAAILNSHIASKTPVIIRNVKCIKKAVKKWTPEYINSFNPQLKIPIKQYGETSSINIKKLLLKDYVKYLTKLRSNYEESNEKLMYCHDIPIFHFIHELNQDIKPSFLNAIPKWYHEKWWRYVQFFMGPAGSFAPLHFDCLMTHNLFFQIKGEKRFTLIDPKYMNQCGRLDWRWFKFNPEVPDYLKFPEFKNIKIQKIVLSSGDMIYMPPCMLHCVKGLSESISFNIDFHTSSSVLSSLPKIFKMPIKNLYYNAICMMGIVFKIPSRVLFKFYKSYLNYIS